jgi:thioredoxin:protein disulfide reductase
VPNPLAGFEPIDSLPGLEAQQVLAKKRERPLMVLFHANWCTACKHFEHNVLANQTIQRKLSGWETVLADVTKNDTANQLLLKKFDLIGPPVVLFFDKNGNELTKFRLVGETSRKKFSQLLEDIQKEMQG